MLPDLFAIFSRPNRFWSTLTEKVQGISHLTASLIIGSKILKRTIYYQQYLAPKYSMSARSRIIPTERTATSSFSISGAHLRTHASPSAMMTFKAPALGLDAASKARTPSSNVNRCVTSDETSRRPLLTSRMAFGQVLA